jgi:type I restriction enzyme R subunit
MRVRDDVGFFQAVRSVLNKTAPQQERKEADLDHAIRQIVSQAVASTEVLDIFEAAGLKKPDISILSDQFLGEVHDLPQKNLAVELLKKLLLGEIKTRDEMSYKLGCSRDCWKRPFASTRTGRSKPHR